MTAPAVGDALTRPAGAGEEERLPRHVAIIMDGNRRWARAHGVPEAEGHAAGVEAIRPIVEHRAAERGVEVLTIYAFSRENWQRSSRRGARRSSGCSSPPSATRPRASSSRGCACGPGGPPRGAAGRDAASI